MSALARLKDVFLSDREPDRALFCTYGFDPQLFEREVLPALFHKSLSLDRAAGSTTTYRHEADVLLQRREVMVLCDHHDAEKELLYDLLPVRLPARSAFHAKLAILDYGEQVRIVVSSANLTQPSWTNQLELFAFDDLEPGRSHPWVGPLTTFLSRTRGFVQASARDRFSPFLSRLAEIGPGRARSSIPSLVSSFEGPLFDALVDAAPHSVGSVDVVTPFLEGEAGPGVFDALEDAFPGSSGRLILGPQTAEGGGLQILGPEEKIRTLVADRWTAHQVAESWQGDEDGAPPRSLHGKLVVLHGRRSAVALVGSANFTRAALLGKPAGTRRGNGPRGGNVEIGLIFELDRVGGRRILPRHLALSLDEVSFVETDDEPDAVEPGIERWVLEAIYEARTGEIVLELDSQSPALEVEYEGSAVGSASPPRWQHELRLNRKLEVEVSDGNERASVPFLVADVATLVPRGAPARVGFEDFLDMLAGSRQLAAPLDGELDGERTEDARDDPLLRSGGAIAWRRLLRGLEGLERDFAREAPFPRGTEYMICNASRLAGLRERLRDLRADRRFLDADYAYALHEIGQMLARALRANGMAASSSKLVRAEMKSVRAEFDALRSASAGALRAQLDLLAGR